MKASEFMTSTVHACAGTDTLARAARIMWDHDCGVVPVIDQERHVVGIITDRDVAMAAYLQGRALCQIPVAVAMTRDVHCVNEEERSDVIEELMRKAQVHRIPVVDWAGRLKGIVSLNDLLHRAAEAEHESDVDVTHDGLTRTLAAITRPRGPTGAVTEKRCRTCDPTASA